VFVVGLSHRTAPIEVRELLAVAGDALDALRAEIASVGGTKEVVLLSTCNRLEVFAAAGGETKDAETAAMAAVRALLVARGGRTVAPHLRALAGREAVEHLFRVASSLDSLVVGEPQILGQLKDAIFGADRAGTLGPRLWPAMRGALQVGKRVRAETNIGEGQISVPSVAVDLARRIFEDLRGRVVLLLGAGDMAETAARLLARAAADVRIVNRSPERAAALVAAVGGRAVAWEALEAQLVEAHIVVSSTSAAGYVVGPELLRRVRRARRGKSLFLIDIAVPRDVDPAVAELDNVYLYDIDDLSRVVAAALAGRASEAARAEDVVAREVERFETRRAERAVAPVIVGLRERTRRVLGAELERSLRGKLKHLGESERRALVVMLEAASNKLLHAPTARLRAAAGEPEGAELAQALCELFSLDDLVREEARREEPEIRVATLDGAEEREVRASDAGSDAGADAGTGDEAAPVLPPSQVGAR
jgi:glutamyl-tRNA reductase